MLQSMTAFGQSLVASKDVELIWELRGVNHRFLDISMRLPETLRPIDANVREMIAATVHRGKVDVTVKFSDLSDVSAGLVLNKNLLKQLCGIIDQVQDVRIDAGRIDPVQLMQWPGLVSSQSTLAPVVLQTVLDSFSAALEDFSQSRAREGMQLAEMLGSRAARLSELVSELREHRPGVVSRQREKLLARLAELDIEHEPGRLEQELVYAAQRLDIDEELDRLDAHLLELSHVLERDEAVGRRLDFLMQELNRETNTVSSKAYDSVTSALSIDMKVLIEQMREQVQNVE